jgi:hypothetical protein
MGCSSSGTGCAQLCGPRDEPCSGYNGAKLAPCGPIDRHRCRPEYVTSSPLHAPPPPVPRRLPCIHELEIAIIVRAVDGSGGRVWFIASADHRMNPGMRPRRHDGRRESVSAPRLHRWFLKPWAKSRRLYHEIKSTTFFDRLIDIQISFRRIRALHRLVH